MARKEYVVFGLGRFGMSVAKTLADNGCQVMAVDSEQSKVEEIAEDVTYAVCTDVTDADAYRLATLSGYSRKLHKPYDTYLKEQEMFQNNTYDEDDDIEYSNEEDDLLSFLDSL